LQKDYSSAIIDLNKSIDINPKLFISYLNRGLAKMKLRQANNAIKDFDNVLKLIPNFLDAIYYKGLGLAFLKNYDDAIAQFDRCINIDDKFAMAYYYRGTAKGSKENLKGAIIDFNKAIELDKSNPDFYFARAAFRKFSNDTIGSCEDLEKAKNLGFDKVQTLIEELCYETKKVEEDIEVPFAVIESVPEYPGCERGSNAEKRKCMSDKIAKFIQRRFNTDLALGLGLYGKQRISVIFKID
jgi:tetratricopeptide (TPR) repeat protein